MRTLLPLLALTLPATLTAQTNNFWLPKGAEKTQTAIYDQSYFGYAGYDSTGSTAYTPIHVQNGYATADAPVAAAKISAVWFRRNNFYGNTIYASSTDLAVHMSTNATDTNSWSTTFATNEGTNRIQVFGSGGASKTVNWPADPYVNNGQQPVPFAHKIPFDTAFVFVQSSGKSVCLDYYITKRLHTYTSGSTTYHTTLLLDADGKAVGTRLANGNAQSSCKFSDGKYNSSLGYTTAGLTDAGGTWYLNYGSILPSAPGVATLSAYGVDSKPNPFNNPIDMTPFGAPNCYWYVGLETGFWVACNADSSGQAKWPTLTIPAGLGGSAFYDQGLWLDAAANKLGLVPSWSSKWPIVMNYSPAAVTVYKRQDTTPPAATGAMVSTYALITQFDY